MKKIFKLAIPMAIMACTATPVFADNYQDSNNYEGSATYDNIYNPTYTSFMGIVREVNNSEGDIYITVEYKGELNTFKVYDKTLVVENIDNSKIDSDNINIGQMVNVFFMYDTLENIRSSDELKAELVVIKHNEYTEVKLDLFNEDLQSSNNLMQLNIINETEILDINGNTVSIDNISNKHLIIFYTVSQQNNPALTTPDRIIVLDENDYAYLNREENKDYELSSEEKDILYKIGKENVYKKDDILYVGLAAVAAEINYNVTWYEGDRKVSLENGHELYEFIIGEKTFKYNGDEYSLNFPPILINDRTFIEENFLDKLLK